MVDPYIELDSIIEDLSSGDARKCEYAKRQLIIQKNTVTDALEYLEYNRIVRRLDSGDISGTIEMLREMQKSETYYIWKREHLAARHRTLDWEYNKKTDWSQ